MRARRGSLGLWAAAMMLASTPAMAGSLDREVLDEINYARAHPADYAQVLRDTRAEDDRYGGVGAEAREEAIAFLERQQPLPPLAANPILATTAAEHTAGQGPTGLIGHRSADGASPSERIHRHGAWPIMSAETISYGYDTAGEVVRQLIIDYGVANRGHRAILFNASLQTAGAGCGPHTVYQHMCVIDFAGGPARFSER